MSAPQPPGWPGTRAISAADVAIALGLPIPTDEQRAVIEAPPAPALVVAGAGSGKTETMAGRVVWLVAGGHVRRDEVLGLTFTRKAAGELAERIHQRLERVDEYARRGLLPHLPALAASGALAELPQSTPERLRFLDALAAEHAPASAQAATSADAGDLLLRPRVSTYNAFADALVREHAARIGRDPEAVLLSDSGSWLLARQVVIDADEPALADQDAAMSTLIDAVSTLAGDALDHRADLDEVARYGDRFAEMLAEHADLARHTPGKPELALRSTASLSVVARLAKEYARLKRENGVLDFADQVAGALEIIEASPDIVAELRAQYRVVLLDEYQDTSVIQTQLLSAIFADAAVMAVGDPNQSIYGWRGASADNLSAFASAFAHRGPSLRFDLSISWRNDTAILDAANALLAAREAPARLDVPRLRARPGAEAGRVEVRYEETIDAEADAVASWFAKARAAHVAEGNPEGSHSGAILFRAKKHMPLFADALAARGIPHRILGLGGLLATPEVADVVSALRVIDDPGAGSALLRLLAGPRFAIGVADLAALHELARTLSQRDAALAPLDRELLARIRGSAGPDEQLSIVEALEFVRTTRSDYRLLAALTDEGRGRLREAGEMFARLRHGVGQPIPELLRQIETELRLDVELAANEARGPARLASMQLRAFADEVRSFLEASGRGSIGALLSWLARAEGTDELAPRPEPPEPGVVQLLTIHGAKGLEWDATAVVRWVTDELPQKPRSTQGWLRLGGLPHSFRGDRDALPDLSWDRTEPLDRKAIERAIGAYNDAMRAYLEEEERRLAYVAVTRSRGMLLLTGSWWATQQRPRTPSGYLATIVQALELDEPRASAFEENPRDPEGRTLIWPQDPLGSRRPLVEAAAQAVREVTDAAPTPELAQLLAERELRRRGVAVTPPTRIPASRFKDYVTDFGGTVRAIARPMPERPYPQTALGTLFHAWVEHRYGKTGTALSLDDALWESDEEASLVSYSATAHDREALARLQETFERSEWATLSPLEVETEIDFALPGAGGEPEHIVICKLDAVFRRDDRGGRIEIVDWKTGRAPRTPEEKDERMLQLALYRLAYHRRHGVPLDQIDVALYYVADDLVIREDRVYSEEELVQRWSAARAAR